MATSTDSEAEREQEAAREIGTQRRLGDQVHAEQTVQRGVQHPDRHHHAGRRRRLAVRIGLPGMHRREAGLRAVPDQREHDAEAERKRMQRRGVRHELRPMERRQILAERALRRRKQEHRPEQGEAEPEAPEHQELPRRFEGGIAIVKRDEKHRRQRRQLDGDPQDPEVVRDRDQQHGEDIRRGEHRELLTHPRRHQAAGVIPPDVSNPVQRREQADEAAQHEDERRQAVHTQRLVERRRHLSAEELPGGGEA